MKGLSKWLMLTCLLGWRILSLAQAPVEVSTVLQRPLNREELAYSFQPLVLDYPQSLPLNAPAVKRQYYAYAAGQLKTLQQFPADGRRVLLVFSLHNAAASTSRLIFPLPTLKTKLKFGHIAREKGRSVHFYHEIEAWACQSYRSLVYRPEEGKVLLSIPPQQRDTVFIVCNVAKKHRFQLYNAAAYQELTAVPALHYLMFYVALLSFLSFSIFLGIIQYVQQRDVAFVYYVIYLGLMWFLIFRRLEKINPFLDLGLYFPAASWWWEHLRAPAYLLSFVAYQIFIYYLLHDRVQMKWLEKFIFWSNIALVGLIPVHFVTKLYWERLDFMQAVLAPLALFWIWNFVQLYQRKLGIMISWVLLGSFLAALGTIAGNFVGTRLEESPLTFLHMGDMPLHFAIVIDVLCLAVALSFRHHIILRDRNEAQNVALKTAKYNIQHAKTLSEVKKEELNQRKTDLQKQSEGLIQQQISALETQKQQALAETELLALREQLKPHFVANCINSIRNLIAWDKAADASLYLSKLGVLLGQIFELTEKPSISLREELDLLKLYLDLEQLRFRDRFKVVFNIDPAIDLEEFHLPPLLLQPYAENAIKHAFTDKHPEQALRIVVQYASSTEAVILAIEDNGIGHQASRDKKPENLSNTSGVGMKLCADRLKLFNERFQQKSFIQVVDVQEEGVAKGTRVEIYFPFPKYQYHDD
jgi:hypothetical protein